MPLAIGVDRMKPMLPACHPPPTPAQVGPDTATLDARGDRIRDEEAAVRTP